MHDTQATPDKQTPDELLTLTDALRGLDPDRGSYAVDGDTILYMQGCEDETVGHIRRDEWTVSLAPSVETDHPELLDALQRTPLTVEIQSAVQAPLADRLDDALGEELRVTRTRGEGRIVVYRGEQHIALGRSDDALWIEEAATPSEAGRLHRACAALEIEIVRRPEHPAAE